MKLATPPPPRSAPLPSTSSAGDVVYETETSPFSAGFTRARRPTALGYDDDDDDADTGAVSKDVDTGAVSERETRKYGRKSFGTIASPYLAPYVHKSGILDSSNGAGLGGFGVGVAVEV